MCLSVRGPPPDPWEEFIYEVVWPFVELNAKVGVGLLALVVFTGLIVGLFGDLSTCERRVCGALPLSCGVATFIGVVIFTRDRAWWEFHSEAQTTLLALAFCVGMLGLLVVERRLFIEDAKIAPLPAPHRARRAREFRADFALRDRGDAGAAPHAPRG